MGGPCSIPLSLDGWGSSLAKFWRELGIHSFRSLVLRQQMKQRWKPRLGVIFLLGKT